MATWSKYTMCIAPYSSLQFCDFLCSLLSFWITLLVLANIPSRVRYFLFVLGMFALILPVNMNSTGLIANVVPIVAGLLIVIGSWVSIRALIVLTLRYSC
jgi:transmembrane protein 8A/B